MTNEGGDSAFGGDIPGEHIYDHTGLIMAFDVSSTNVPDTSAVLYWNLQPFLQQNYVDNFRRVGLFEGTDTFGRLQPMRGGEKDTNVIELFTWSEPTTETPGYGQVEEWEIYNFTPHRTFVKCALIY